MTDHTRRLLALDWNVGVRYHPVGSTKEAIEQVMAGTLISEALKQSYKLRHPAPGFCMIGLETSLGGGNTEVYRLGPVGTKHMPPKTDTLRLRSTNIPLKLLAPMYLRSVLVNVSMLIPTVYSAILGDLRPAFVNPLPPARGSCSVDQLQELTIGFREAIGATKKAAQAIDNLKNSAPNSVIHKDKNRTWKRQAQLLKALFNIDVDKKLGDGNNDANLLQSKLRSHLS